MYTKRINRKILKIISAATAFIFVFSVVSPGSALAGRSSAGGGELSSFDVGKFAMTVGISVASIGIGAAIGSGVNSALQGGNAIASIGSSLFSSFMKVGSLAQNYNTFVAVSQVGRAVGMAGSYHGWDPSTTFIVSSVASGITAGALNPSTYVGSSMGKTVLTTGLSAMGRGAVIGGVSGLASGGAVVAIDGDKINEGDQPGVGAQVAGMTAGMVAASFTRTAFDPNTRNVSSFKKFDGNDAQLKQSSGADSILKSTERVGMDFGKLTTADAANIYHSDKTQFLGKTADGQNQFMVSDAQKPLASADNSVSQKPIFFSLSDSQVNMMDNIRANPDGSIWAPVQGAPDSSTLAGRYMLYPAVDTFNQWPARATSAISIAATQNMDPTWKPLALAVINSVGGSVLDSAAVVYSLKPSLAFNVDQNLGLRPDAKIQQAELFNQARIPTIAKQIEKVDIRDDVMQEVQKTLPTDFNSKPPEEQTKILQAKLQSMGITPDTIVPDSLKVAQTGKAINITADQKKNIFGSFSEKMRLALQSGETRFIPKQRIFEDVNGYINENIGKSSKGRELNSSDNLDYLNQVGGSRGSIFLTSLKNSMTYDLPVALISGGVQAGLTKMIDDKDQTSNMLVSLAGVAATGIARGVVWSVDNNLRYNREMAAASEERFSPELVSRHNVSDQAKIVLARVSGDLPIPDNKEYAFVTQSYLDSNHNLVDNQIVEKRKSEVNEGLQKMGLSSMQEGPVNLSATSAARQLDAAREQFFVTELKNNAPELFREYQSSQGGSKISRDAEVLLADMQNKAYHEFDLRLDETGGAVSKLSENISYLQKQIIPVGRKEEAKSGQASFRMAPDTSIKVDSVDYVYRLREGDNIRVIKPGDSDYAKIQSSPTPELYSLDFSTDPKGVLAPAGKKFYEGKPMQDYPVVRPPGLFSTVMGSLGQSLYEYGTQSFSMGLPVIQRNNLSTYALYDYSQRVNAMAYSTLETGGLTSFMARQASEVGQGVIARNVLTTVSNTPLGSLIGMSRFRPVAGYNKMPFTVAVVVDSRFGGADQRFFSNWPTNALGVVPRDPLHNAFRSSLISRTASNYFDINQDTVPSFDINQDTVPSLESISDFDTKESLSQIFRAP